MSRHLENQPSELPSGTGDFAEQQSLRVRGEGLPVLITVYVAWALLPLYWSQLNHVPSFEVLCHRSFWGFLFVLGLLWRQRRLGDIRTIFRDRRTLLFMAGCSTAHLCSWGLFIWAIAHGRLLESSLGHYILPLCSVLSGFFIFRERPRRLQWVTILIAAIGVAGMVFRYGALPWVTLATAGCSVGFTVCRKYVPGVTPTAGLVADMLLSSPLLWGYLLWLHLTGQGTLGSEAQTVLQDIWLIGAGIVTMLPQLGFAYGLSRVSLTTLGLLQYLPPTGAFLIGVFVLSEPFSPDKVFGFSFIWTGVILFTIEGIHYYSTHLKTSGCQSASAQSLKSHLPVSPRAEKGYRAGHD